MLALCPATANQSCRIRLNRLCRAKTNGRTCARRPKDVTEERHPRPEQLRTPGDQHFVPMTDASDAKGASPDFK
jgi:hypothetical protein